MKMCKEHWAKMQDAIKSRGLDHLVSKDGAECVQRVVAAAENGDVKRNYDPLFDLNLMLTSGALKCGGLYMMGEKEDGSEYCGLCELNAHYKVMAGALENPAQHWIDCASDSILDFCQKNNMQG